MSIDITLKEHAAAAAFRTQCERVWWLAKTGARNAGVDFDVLLDGGMQPHVVRARTDILVAAHGAGVPVAAIACILGLPPCDVASRAAAARRVARRGETGGTSLRVVTGGRG